MDWLKIQIDMLKDIYASNIKGTKSKLLVNFYDEKYWVTVDRVLIYAIPMEYMFVNTMKCDSVPNAYIDKVLQKQYCEEIAEPIITDIKMRKMQEFKLFGNNKKVYVDSKLLKYFPLDKCTFFATDCRNPVFVKQNNELVGIVMPILTD